MIGVEASEVMVCPSLVERTRRVDCGRCARQLSRRARRSSVVLVDARGRHSVGGRQRPGKAAIRTLIVDDAMVANLSQ